MSFETPGIEQRSQEFLGPIDQNIADVFAADVILCDRFNDSIASPSPKNDANLDLGKNEAGAVFRRLVQDVLGHPIYNDEQKTIQLSVVYREVTDQRVEHFKKSFMRVDPEEMRLAYKLDENFAPLLKEDKNARNFAGTLAANYIEEINKDFEYIKSLYPKSPLDQEPVVTKKNSVVVNAKTMALGAAGLMLAGYAAKLKLKSRWAKGS